MTAKTGLPNPKDSIGDTKPDLSLIPSAALVHEALCMGDGADKYGPYNWREHPVRLRVYVAACMRHLVAYLDGEQNARDSGRHHLGHARSCLGILLDAEETGNLIDDRPLPGKAGDMLERFTTKPERRHCVPVTLKGGTPAERVPEPVDPQDSEPECFGD